MPIIEVTLPQGALPEERLAGLVADLTASISRWEAGPGVPDDFAERYAKFSWVTIYEVPPNRMAIAGKLRDATSKPLFRIDVAVPMGSLDAQRKAGLVQDVTNAVIQAEGDESASGRVLCLINEWPDGNVGSLGRLLFVRDLAAMLNVDPDSERYRELLPDQATA